MNKEEALKTLEDAPKDDKTSRVNKNFTTAKVTEIIYNSVVALPDGKKLTQLHEKRVWQAVKNQRRPKYDPT